MRQCEWLGYTYCFPRSAARRRPHPLLPGPQARTPPPGGSNNFRRFRLDAEAVAQFAECEEISASTIPPDFERNGRIHRAWRLTVG